MRNTASTSVRVALFTGLIVLTAGCGGPPAGPAPADGQQAFDRPLLVFGAASTTNALDEACTAFERDQGLPITTSYASSSALAQQILNGAAAHIFLSANAKWAEAIAAEGLIEDRVDLLGNRLVVIVPADSDLQLQTLAGLSGPAVTRLALADPAAVPAGIYARQTLEHEGLWSALEPKAVAGADVRQALAYVEQGAAEAGMVYATDAAMTDRVKVLLEIDPLPDNPIIYPLILLKSNDAETARSLFAHLQSRDAAAIFERYGFAVRAAEN